MKSRMTFFASIWMAGMTATASAQTLDCRIGLDRLGLRDFAAAIDPLTKCLENRMPNPPRAYLLRRRAEAFAVLGRYKRAIEDQEKSLQVQPPYDVWPLVMLAAYRRDKKDYSGSLEALAEARKYDEDGPGTGPGMAVNYHTGLTLHASGKYAEAVEAYSKGIPKQPDYGYVYIDRALSYEALGDKVNAKRDLEKAAELAPPQGYERNIVRKMAEYGVPVKPARR